MFRCPRISHLSFLVAFLVFLVLPGCGGGGSDSNSEITGVVIDAPIGNLRFSTDTGIDGFTGIDGDFTVPTNSNLNFFIGDVLLNQVPIPADFVITLLDFVPGATDETDPTVTNLARLIQTLDLDGVPENGLEIPASVNNAAAGMSINFAVDTSTFESDAGVSTLLAAHPSMPALISVAQAQMNFAGALLETCGGLYEGTYGGDEFGDVIFVAQRGGTVDGYILGEFDSFTTDILGSLDSTCFASFDSGGMTGFQFDGQITDGVINGTWNNTVTMAQGTFTAGRTTSYAPALLSTDIAFFDVNPGNPMDRDYEGFWDYNEPGTGQLNGFVCFFLDSNGDFEAFFDTQTEESCVTGTLLGFANGQAQFVGVNAVNGYIITGSINESTLSGGGTIFPAFGGDGGFDFDMIVIP
ncbi:MAG: hypothetical protein ACI97A_003444 [Planctomycetota bacterium]|jgi:hypothetical protein